MAMSEDHGNNLQTVQLLLKKNQVSFPFLFYLPSQIFSDHPWLDNMVVYFFDLLLEFIHSIFIIHPTYPFYIHCSYPVQSLQKEIEGHQPRIDEVLERGRRMVAAAEGSPQEEHMSEEMKKLQEVWAKLQDEMAKRRARLYGSNEAQQYYNDADEAEAWIGEQELYMIADEKAKVRLWQTARAYEEQYCFFMS